MKIFSESKKFKIVTIIVVTISFFTKCIGGDEEKIVITNHSGEQFAGSSQCQNCHREIWDSFVNTAHFHTSQPASLRTVMGSFIQDSNLFSYSYYSKIAMEQRDSGLYQVEYDKNFKQKQAKKLDIIIGSGTRGQSYLSWVNNRLIQLPISFFTSANAWANSPGYPNSQPLFTRNITATCLECHSTYFKTLSPENIHAPEFDRKQILYGIQCESCHGPAQKHVNYQQQHPNELKGKYIKNPALFTRQQKLDLCAFCHGGIKESDEPAFSFAPGDTLANYFKSTSALIQPEEVEVHDNQYGLLTESKCFRMSKTMTCNTCHNTHDQERGKLDLFSKRCMNCHNNDNVAFCKMSPSIGNQITRNCIDCHMPQKQSKMLTLQLEGSSNGKPSLLRSHLIAVYPNETTQYLHTLQK